VADPTSSRFALSVDQFTAGVNILICAIVSAWSLYWRKQPRNPGQQWRMQAYTAWILGWLAWVVAWLLLLLSETVFQPDDPRLASIKIVVAALDNVNALCLVVFYLHLTRGNDYSAKDALADFLRMGSSAALFTIMVWVFPRLGDGSGAGLSMEVYRTLSMCAAIVAPIIVGWGVFLRFGTRVALAIGFVYGGLQPFVYSTQIAERPGFQDQRPVITMIIAGLKVLWAVSILAILAVRDVERSDALVIHVKRRPIALTRFIFGTLLGGPARAKWLRNGVRAHTLSLVLAYIICCVVLCLFYVKSLADFGLAIGVVTGVLELLRRAWKIIGIFDTNPAERG
jgi:hypothetical protein